MTVSNSALALAFGRARLRQHHAVVRSAVGASTLVGGSLAILLWGTAPPPLLLGWLATLAAVLALRLGIDGIAWRRGDAELRHLHWLRLTRVAYGLHGLVWGGAVLLIGWQIADRPLDMMVFMVTAIAAGSVAATAFDLVAAALFAVPAMVPLLLRLTITGDAGDPPLAAAVGLVLLVMLVSARRTGRVVQEGVRLQLESTQRADEANEARLQLADQHQLLTQLLQTTQQGCWFVDTQGLTTNVNPAMCELMGRPRDQIVGHSLYEFFKGSELQTLQDEMAARQSGQRGSYEVDILRPDGTRRRGHNNATPIFDAQGTRVGSVGLWTDLTAHVKAEEALRTYELVTNSITDSVSVIGEDLVYRMVNDAWVRTLGIPRAQVLGRKARELLPSVSTDERREALNDCLRLQETRRVTGPVDLPALQGRLIETSYFPYSEPVAGVRCVVVVTRDVTEHEAVREALADSAIYLHRTLNATGDAIFASDADDPQQPVRFSNAQMLQLWGMPPALAGNLTPADIMDYALPLFSDPEAELQRIGLIIASNLTDESRLSLRDGRVLLRRCVPTPLGGRILRVWTFRDISAEVRALEDVRASETALIAARDEAERANAAKSRFLSHMSHELRTPMNAILGFAQLLGDDRGAPLNALQRVQVAEILRGGHHLLALINEVLDLGRIESDQLALRLVPVPLAGLVADGLALMQALARSHEVRLLPPVGLSSSLAVLADPLRLKQVLLNLLGNAVKYNRRGGDVEVECALEGAHAVLTVRDTGPGLDTASQARLFQPFERLAAGRTTIEGTGIGLALSRRLVEAMGGEIGVHSEPGMGSRFWVRLPCAVVLPAEGPKVAEPVSGAPIDATAAPLSARLDASVNAVRTALYIEDNPVNALLMEGMLEGLPGLRLLVALQPAEGLEIARREKPALVMLDIQMPEMDGFEVLARLRADPELGAVPVLAVSANARQVDIDEALAAGFDGYLTKPLDMTLLLRTVRDALAGQRA